MSPRTWPSGKRSRTIGTSRLRWGTPTENALDRHVDGTFTVAKLRPSDVREIRRLVGNVPMSEIAARYGVTKTVVSSIHNKRSWAHLPDQ